MIAGSRTHCFALVFTGILAAALCSCGARTGTVAGKATVDGKPAAGATVIFSGGENQSATAVVEDDGTYQTPGVPVGPVKVAIMPRIGGMGAGRLPARRGVVRDKENLPPLPSPSSPSLAIPKRYTSVDTSGLSLTVQSGRNEFNIAMRSR